MRGPPSMASAAETPALLCVPGDTYRWEPLSRHHALRERPGLREVRLPHTLETAGGERGRVQKRQKLPPPTAAIQLDDAAQGRKRLAQGGRMVAQGVEGVRDLLLAHPGGAGATDLVSGHDRNVDTERRVHDHEVPRRAHDAALPAAAVPNARNLVTHRHLGQLARRLLDAQRKAPHLGPVDGLTEAHRAFFHVHLKRVQLAQLKARLVGSA
mmetsp:Transcript_13878/g.37757  ORF Transcript_13878/g.37757 Transcript_13878/m.37757 type:complete len:212 (+) Transcript_13878:108-743(+)